jgi:hypothetical protein
VVVPYHVLQRFSKIKFHGTITPLVTEIVNNQEGNEPEATITAGSIIRQPVSTNRSLPDYPTHQLLMLQGHMDPESMGIMAPE